MSVVVHCIGEQGQQAAAAAATRVIERFHPAMMFLCGIAAGRRTSVKIGDVAIPRAIVDTTIKVAEAGALHGRPKIPQLPHVVEQMVAAFRLDASRWHKRFRKLFGPKKLRAAAGKEIEYAEHVAQFPALHDVAIASDNLLLRDTEVLEAASRSLHQHVRVGEMEAAGFVTACEERSPRVPWFVVRGISDFGDNFKSDDFHRFASCAAASYVAEFLAYGFDADLLDIRCHQQGGRAMRIRSRTGALPQHQVGRRNVIESLVQRIVSVDQSAIPVLGSPGIGKSTLTLAVLRHSRIEARFRRRRFFVSLEAANSADAMIALLAGAVGVKTEKTTPTMRAICTKLQRARALLILDNLETALESDTANVEALLATLMVVPHLTLLASIRGAQSPSNHGWSTPEVVKALDKKAAQDLFCSIAPEHRRAKCLTALLKPLSGVPLAITLLARQAQGNDLANLRNEWNDRRTTMFELAIEPDRHSSWKVSLELSWHSRRFSLVPAARYLMSLLATLPDGIATGDLDTVLSDDRWSSGRTRSTGTAAQRRLRRCAGVAENPAHGAGWGRPNRVAETQPGCGDPVAENPPWRG